MWGKLTLKLTIRDSWFYSGRVFLSATRLLPTPAKKMTCRSGYRRHLDGCFTVSVTVPCSFHTIWPLLFHIHLILADIPLFSQVSLLYFTPFSAFLCLLLARGSRWLRRCGSDVRWRVITQKKDKSRIGAVLGLVVYYKRCVKNNYKLYTNLPNCQRPTQYYKISLEDHFCQKKQNKIGYILGITQNTGRSKLSDTVSTSTLSLWDTKS